MASSIDPSTYKDETFSIFSKEAETAVANAQVYSKTVSNTMLDMFLNRTASEADINKMAHTLFTTR